MNINRTDGYSVIDLFDGDQIDEALALLLDATLELDEELYKVARK